MFPSPLFSSSNLGLDVESSPVRVGIDFDSDADCNASPRSTPAPRIPEPQVHFGAAQPGEDDFESWIARVPVANPRKKTRPAVVLRPFASCEATELSVKTLNALMEGRELPLTFQQQLAMIGRPPSKPFQ
jgi:hypothetical protein